MTPEYLAQLEELAQCAIPGEMTLPATEVLIFVSAYRKAQRIRRLCQIPLSDHDMTMLRNFINQLPAGGTGPLWVEPTKENR